MMTNLRNNVIKKMLRTLVQLHTECFLLLRTGKVLQDVSICAVKSGTPTTSVGSYSWFNILTYGHWTVKCYPEITIYHHHAAMKPLAEEVLYLHNTTLISACIKLRQ